MVLDTKHNKGALRPEVREDKIYFIEKWLMVRENREFPYVVCSQLDDNLLVIEEMFDISAKMVKMEAAAAAAKSVPLAICFGEKLRLDAEEDEAREEDPEQSLPMQVAYREECRMNMKRFIQPSVQSKRIVECLNSKQDVSISNFSTRATMDLNNDQ